MMSFIILGTWLPSLGLSIHQRDNWCLQKVFFWSHQPSVRQPYNKVDIVHFNSQWFPIEIECLDLWIPTGYQCLKKPHLGPHSFYEPKFIDPTSLQRFLGPHISFYRSINLLMLPFPPFNHHHAKETSKFESILSKNLCAKLYMRYHYNSHV
jgi:hypothetical protein